MNEPINDGGPAFAAPGILLYSPEGVPLNPWAGHGWNVEPQPGMSLRDWFAGKALNGMVAACADKTYHLSLIEQAQKHETPVALHAARLAYETADAMLKAREQQ